MDTPSDPSKTQLELILETLFSNLRKLEEFDAELIQSLKSIADNDDFKSASTIEIALNSGSVKRS